MTRLRTLPALLLAPALLGTLLSGCVPADPLDAAARETVAALDALEADQREAAAIALAAAGEDEAWRAWGVETTGVPGILESLSGWVLDERDDPGMQLASTAASIESVGSAFGIGFIAIGALGKDAVSQSNDGTRGTDTTSTPGGEATVSVGADGNVRVEYSSSATDGDLSMTVSASSDIMTCPDPSGAVEVSADVAVRVSLGTAGGSIELRVDATGQLDEMASLASSEYEYRQQHSASSGGAGEFLDHSGTSAGEVTVNRSSSAVTADFAKGAAEMAAALARIVADDLLAAAQDGWMSGRCVEVTLTPSEDPGSLETEADITIDADAHSTVDGQLVDGTLFPTLEGEGHLGSDGSRVPAPATFDYRAADELDRTGVLTVESRSIRGVGRASIALSTGGGAYNARVTVDEYSAYDLICSLTEPFDITGSGLTFSFTPSGPDGGSFRMTGARYGITFIGDGTYSVSYDDHVATNLLAEGQSALTTSEGLTSDAPVMIDYELTPTMPCD